jgi:flagellin-like protein
MMRLHGNKRAVSPVIATVLMILIVMAGMTLLFGFVGSYATSFQNGSGGSVLESLTFEDTWFTTRTDNGQQVLSIWIYNTGKADIELNSLYANGTLVSMYGSDYNLLDSNTLVKIGAHFQVVIQVPWQPGDSYTIKIVTPRGSGFEEAFTAP